MKSTVVALLASTAAAKDLALTWKDCGGAGTKTKITSFSPSTITLGQKTTLTGKGDLSEQVTGADFDLVMTGATGQLLHCSGDASVTKSCNLPLGTGSLTFEAMSFPIAPGSVPVNVDIKLSSLLPGALTKTKTITKATAKNGDDLFCMEIDSASATEENDEDLIDKIPPLVGKLVCELAEKGEQPAINAICSKVHLPDCQGLLQKVFDKLLQKCQPSGNDFVEGGNLNLAWSDCGDSSFHAKVKALAPTTLPIGKTTTVTGSGNTDEQVTAGGFQITAKFGPVTEHYSGDVCAKKVFHLPAFLGSITWKGLTCPVAKGSVSVGVDVQLASIIPAKLAKGDILIKASDASSNGNLICLDIKTSGAQIINEAPKQCMTPGSACGTSEAHCCPGLKCHMYPEGAVPPGSCQYSDEADSTNVAQRCASAAKDESCEFMPCCDGWQCRHVSPPENIFRCFPHGNRTMVVV